MEDAQSFLSQLALKLCICWKQSSVLIGARMPIGCICIHWQLPVQYFAEIRHTMLTFDIRLVAYHSEAELIYNVFFSSAGYLATSSLYSFVVLNWPQALLILKCHRSLQLWGWLRSTSKKQFLFTGIWCTQVLCVIVLENIPINKQIYVWTYNWARHISWFPVAVPWGLACFAPDTSDLSPWRWIFLILAFPREMLYPKNRSWIPWIHCALLKHTWRLWVYTSPTTTCFFQYAIWRLDIRLHQNVRSCTVRPLTTPRSSDKA